MAQKIYLKKSSVVDKTPAASTMEFGELAINYASGTGKAFLTTKKYDGTMAKFHEDSYNDGKFATKSDISNISSSVDGAVSKANSAFNYTAAVSATVKSQYWNSSTTNTNITNAKNSAVSSAASYANDTFFTKASAGTMYDDLNGLASGAKTAAESAFNYTNAVSGTVKSKYWDSATTNNKIVAAKNEAVTSAATSAATYANNTFLTKASAGTMYNSLHGEAADAKSAANSAFNYTAAVSATVKGTYATKDDANTAANNAAQSALTRANAYTDAKISGFTSGNFLTVASAESIVTTLNSGIQSAKNSANSAFNYTAAVSATVKNQYWNSATTNTKITDAKNAGVTSAVTCATTYANNTFVKTSTYNSYTGDVASSLQTLAQSAQTLSGNIITLSGNIATKLSSVYKYKGTKATYANLPETGNETGDVWNVEAANGNIPAGTNYAWDGTKWDALGGSIDLSGFVTSESAGSMYSTLESLANGAKTAANSAFNYTAAVSATVKAQYWTSATTNTKITDAKNAAVTSAATSAVTYANNTFFTKSSAATMYNDLNGASTDAKNAANSAYNYTAAVSATVKAQYWTSATTNTKITDAKNAAVTSAATSAVSYANSTFLTKASAGTMYNNVNGTATDAKNAAESAYNYTNAVSATVKATYWTSAETNNKIVAAKNAGVTSAATSAVTYANNTFLTKASAGTMYNTLHGEASDAQSAANSAFNYTAAVSATVKNTYATKDYANTAANDAAQSALTRANAYTDSKISGFTSGNFLTVASAESIVTTLNSSIQTAQNKADSAYNRDNATSATVKAQYWNSATTNTKITDAKNAGVTSALTSAVTYANNTFLTKASAGTMYNSVNGTATDAKNAAESAYNYTAAVSATVKGGYWTSATTNTKITDAKNAGVTSAATSAVTYANNTFLTKASAGTMYNNVNGTATDAKNIATSAYNYTDAVSATVKNQYWNSSTTNTKITDAKNAAVTSAATSAVSYANSTFFTKASAGTMYTTLNNAVTTAQNKADSAYNRDNATSATVKAGYWTSADTNTKIGAASAASFNSAKTYADGTFFTKASAGTMYNTLNGKISDVSTAQGQLSGSVIEISGAIATKLSNVYQYMGSVTNYSDLPATGKVNGYVYNVVNANGNTPAGTNYAWNGSAWDALGGTIDLSGYFTKASAGTMYNDLHAEASTAQSKADSAYNRDNATSATVKAGYWTSADTNTKLGATSAASFNSAKTYADGTFLTKASAGTMYNSVHGEAADAQSAANSAYNYTAAVSATVKNQYWNSATTNTKIGASSAASFNSAKTYADNTFITKASAGTKFSTIESSISELSGSVKSDYMLKHAYVASGATRGRWSVTIPDITEYYDGLTIHVRLATEYDNVYNRNTLNVNGLGDVFVYYRYNSIATSHFGMNAEVTLTYRETAGSYKSSFNYGTIVSGTTYTNGWVANFSYYSDTNYNVSPVNERRYAGSRLTRYQVVGLDKDGRVQPLTKVDSGDYNVGTNKPVNTVGFRPERFFYRATTGITAAGAADVAQVEYEVYSSSDMRYTFNSTLIAYHEVYLRGTYNATENLFYLNTGLTSFYTMVPSSAANITLSNYFVSGDYYIYLGGTYSNNNYFGLTNIHELFYFDGTRLIKQSKKYTDEKISQAGADSSEALSRANSAFNYTAAVSATVKAQYWTSATTNTNITTAKNSAVSSAASYADGTFFTKASAGTMYTTLNNAVTTAQNKADSAYNRDNATSATVKAQYWTSADTNTKILNAITSAATSAVTYSNNTFFTKASAGTMYTTLNNEVTTAQNKADSAYNRDNATSATVKVGYWTSAETASKLSSLSASSFSSAKTYADDTFFTKASAGTMYTTLNNAVTTAQNKADSAYNRDNATSATVKSQYWTSAETNTKLGAVSAASFNSAKTYADSTFFTKASAGTMYTTLNNAVTTAQNKADSAYNRDAATSATVKAGYWTSAETASKLSSLSASSFSSAKTYADDTFFTKASAGTMYTTLNNAVTTAQNKADSAYNRDNATSATVKAGYWTSADTNTKLGATSAASFNSAKTYADSTFFTKASAGTMYNSLNGSIADVRTSAITLSGSVVSLSGAIATKLSNVYQYMGSVTNYSDLPATGKVNGYVYNVVNANGSTPAGTNYAWNGSAWDALGGTVDLSGYLTKSSAGTMYDALNNLATGAKSAAESAFNYTAAVSATVKATYWTSAETNTKLGSTSAASFNSAKTYADDTFLTKASAGTMYSSVNSNATNALTKANQAYDRDNATSATVKAGYWTSAETEERISELHDSAVSDAEEYADNTFLTKESAGTMYDALYEEATNAYSRGDAAYKRDNATSATVKSQYWDSATTQENINSAVGGVTDDIQEWANGEFFTKASAGTMYTTLNNAITTAQGKADSAYNRDAATSATVKSRYWDSATTQENIETASQTTYNNAVSDAQEYADGAFFTKSSAGTMYDDLHDEASAAQTKANQAYNRDNATSATVKAQYWTSATTNTNITTAKNAGVTSAVTCATTYANNTFLTKASAGTMYNTLSNADTGLSNRINILSGTVSGSYVTLRTDQTIVAAKTFSGRTKSIYGILFESANSWTNSYRPIPFAEDGSRTIRYTDSGLTYNPVTADLKAGSYNLGGKAQIVYNASYHSIDFLFLE